MQGSAQYAFISCHRHLSCACTKIRLTQSAVAGYRHQDKGEPAIFQLDSAASSELSTSCRALAMQVALRTCSSADLSAAVGASGCSSKGPQPCSQLEDGTDGSGNTWEWLVGVVSDAPCSAVDVSDDNADVLGFFGRQEDDNTWSWDVVCAGLVASALPEQLVCACEDRSELELIGGHVPPVSSRGTSHEEL